MIKPRVLIFVRHYLPGYKSGGPIRSLANMVGHLGDEFDFWILTLDRDALDTVPYPQVLRGQWQPVGKAMVRYLSPADLSLRRIGALMKAVPHDVLYLNSFFAPRFTFGPLLVRRLGLAPEVPLIIAPRGELTQAALRIKCWKKKPYVACMLRAGLYDKAIWQASSEHEEGDIRQVVGTHGKCTRIATNLPPPCGERTGRAGMAGGSSMFRVLFLSRIAPMKNLDFALRVMANVRVPLEFSIYGPVRDEGYWRQCREILGTLGEHVRVKIYGAVSPDAVPGIMGAHDLFFLPTRGENYGHAIAEAISAGTPLLIADTTPWRGLDQLGIGRDLPLKSEEPFAREIERCAGMSAVERWRWREHVRSYAAQRFADPEAVHRYRVLFREALGLESEPLDVE